MQLHIKPNPSVAFQLSTACQKWFVDTSTGLCKFISRHARFTALTTFLTRSNVARSLGFSVLQFDSPYGGCNSTCDMVHKRFRVKVFTLQGLICNIDPYAHGSITSFSMIMLSCLHWHGIVFDNASKTCCASVLTPMPVLAASASAAWQTVTHAVLRIWDLHKRYSSFELDLQGLGLPVSAPLHVHQRKGLYWLSRR